MIDDRRPLLVKARVLAEWAAELEAKESAPWRPILIKAAALKGLSEAERKKLITGQARRAR